VACLPMLGFTAVNGRLGLAAADHLLVQVCLEAVLAYPLETAWLLLDKAYQIYFDPLMLATPAHGQFPPGSFHSPLAEEVAAAGDYTNPTSADFITIATALAYASGHLGGYRDASHCASIPHMASHARAADFWTVFEFCGDYRQHRSFSVCDLCNSDRYDVWLYRRCCDLVDFARPVLQEISCCDQLI